MDASKLKMYNWRHRSYTNMWFEKVLKYVTLGKCSSVQAVVLNDHHKLEKIKQIKVSKSVSVSVGSTWMDWLLQSSLKVQSNNSSPLRKQNIMWFDNVTTESRMRGAVFYGYSSAKSREYAFYMFRSQSLLPENGTYWPLLENLSLDTSWQKRQNLSRLNTPML